MSDTMTRFLCPGCSKRLKAPGSAAGRTVNCPKCGMAVIIPDGVTDAEDSGEPPRALPPSAAPREPSKALRTKPPPTYVPIPKPEKLEVDPRRQSRAPIAAVSNVIVVQQPSRAAHSFGIASLVVGVLSVVICWIPGFGMLIGGLGLLLGLAGIALAIFRSGTGLGFSIAGTGLSALSFALCWVWTSSLANSFGRVGEAAARQQQTNQKIASGSGSNPEEEWADASKGAVRQGDLEVQVTQVGIGQVPLKTITGNSLSKDNLLMIKVQMVNSNPTKKLEYQSWSGRDFSLDRDYATVRDNFDNSYKRINFGLGTYPVGAIERSESIYPSKSLTDVLVFELPVDTIEFLRLELPAKNFGGTGMLRLRIPKSMIGR
jgi:hypothetical protein